jgi:hypothetical protein
MILEEGKRIQGQNRHCIHYIINLEFECVREVIIVDDMPYGSPGEAVKTFMLRSALLRQNLPVKFT